HPSGDPRPSEQDFKVTRRLVEAGELIGIRVVDHVVVARDGYFSFAQQGRIIQQNQ
ncbi:MAG: JAB domain-containing protein, partial [Myxococcota bacterium]|nr:JAB domain-containing protein [Myxococcota bacterium]